MALATEGWSAIRLQVDLSMTKLHSRNSVGEQVGCDFCRSTVSHGNAGPSLAF